MTSSRLLAALAASLLAAACGEDAPAGPDAAPATCSTYCDTVLDACTGDVAQFVNRDQCLAVCATWPAGTTGDRSGNSLECRAYHATVAVSDAATHCEHAGPAGAGACGSTCEGFCSVVMGACTGGNAAYASAQDCLDACAAFDASEPYDATDVAGDTLACRLYHGAVATSDPATHCPHTQPASGPCS